MDMIESLTSPYDQPELQDFAVTEDEALSKLKPIVPLHHAVMLPGSANAI